MKKEIFKPVKGYEGIYEISNYGRCRRISYKIDTEAKISPQNDIRSI